MRCTKCKPSASKVQNYKESDRKSKKINSESAQGLHAQRSLSRHPAEVRMPAVLCGRSECDLEHGLDSVVVV